MKKQIQGYLAGVLTTALLAGGVVYARTGQANIDVIYDDYKVYIDNTLADLTDANGTTVEPFTYNGTTYLPVRGVAQAMGAQVTYDGATKSVYIWDKMVPGETFLMDVCPPYEMGLSEIFTSFEGTTFDMDGRKRSNGLKIHGGNTSVLFNLDGRFSSLSCDIGHAAEADGEKFVNFIVDGKNVKTVTIKPQQLAEHVTIPLNYGLQLKIVTGDNWYVGLADMIVE